MNLRAANEQRQEALWSVFLMFVVMALVIVRTGVVCRGLNAVAPLEDEPHDAAPGLDHRPPPSSDHLYRAVLVVLSPAEAVGRLLALEARTDWELMNQPRCKPARQRRSPMLSRCARQVPLLDTS